MRPRSVFTAPSYWPTSAAWSSTCWRAMRWRAKSSSFRRRLSRASLSSQVAGELPFGLRELDLERPRVDLGQEIALVDVLPLRERHLHQLAVDAAAHGDGVERRDAAEAAEVDGKVAAAGR